MDSPDSIEDTNGSEDQFINNSDNIKNSIKIKSSSCSNVGNLFNVRDL